MNGRGRRQQFVPHLTPTGLDEFGGMIFTEVSGGTHVEWKSTFELRIPLVGPALTRWIGRPTVTHVFGKILDSGSADLVARSEG